MMRIGVFGPDFMENGGSVRSYGATVCCYRATIFSYRGSVAENGGTIRMNLRARICVHTYIVAILAFYVSHLSHLSLFRKTTGTHGTDGTLVFGFNLLSRAKDTTVPDPAVLLCARKRLINSRKYTN